MIGFQCLRIVQCKHREEWLIDFSACFEKKYEKTPNIGKKLAVLIFFYVGRKNWNILSQILGIHKKLPTQNCSTKLSGRQNPITNVTSLSYVWCTPFWILKTAKGKKHDSKMHSCMVFLLLQKYESHNHNELLTSMLRAHYIANLEWVCRVYSLFYDIWDDKILHQSYYCGLTYWSIQKLYNCKKKWVTCKE